MLGNLSTYCIQAADCRELATPLVMGPPGRGRRHSGNPSEQGIGNLHSSSNPRQSQTSRTKSQNPGAGGVPTHHPWQPLSPHSGSPTN